MKIIIDCSLISKNMRGMGIYLKNILSDIDKISKAEFTLLVNNQYGKNFLEDRFNNKNINVVFIKLPQPIFEQIFIPIYCIYKKATILISSGDSGTYKKCSKKNVLILHDVLYLKNDDNRIDGNTLKRKLGRFYRKVIVKHVSERASHIITVSEFAKKDILDELKVNPKKISIINNGVSKKLKISKDDLSRKTRKILFVSGSDKQKNLKPIIKKLLTNEQIFSSFKSIDVVGVSKDDEIAINKNNFVNYYGFVDHKNIVNLYKEASHFIIPSLYESFGIPAIEALMSGCNVYSSSKGALREVLGQTATFFDPKNHESVDSMVVDLLSSQIIDYHTYENNYLHASKYLWSNSAKQFKNFINEI